MRMRATDAPSALSLHYSGAAEGPAAPFALEMRHFERESARAQLLQPQYAAARTMLLDYFGDLARSVPEKRLLPHVVHRRRWQVRRRWARRPLGQPT